ncbi:MAG: hypothetical protein ACM3MH_10425, partial [Actinomycetota bacterium]
VELDKLGLPYVAADNRATTTITTSQKVTTALPNAGPHRPPAACPSTPPRCRPCPSRTRRARRVNHQCGCMSSSSPALTAPMRPSISVDVDLWARARCFDGVLGPVAEAKLTGRPFEDVWHGYAAEGDRTAAIRFCLICGMTTDQVAETIDRAIAFAQEPVDIPAVWNAILAVAKELKRGRTSGRRAVRALMGAIRLSAA